MPASRARTTRNPRSVARTAASLDGPCALRTVRRHGLARPRRGRRDERLPPLPASSIVVGHSPRCAASEQPVKLHHRRAAAQRWVGAVIDVDRAASHGTGAEHASATRPRTPSSMPSLGARAGRHGSDGSAVDDSVGERGREVSARRAVRPVLELPNESLTVPRLQVQTGSCLSAHRRWSRVLHADGAGAKTTRSRPGSAGGGGAPRGGATVWNRSAHRCVG